VEFVESPNNLRVTVHIVDGPIRIGSGGS
jgi:hypothetical protein